MMEAAGQAVPELATPSVNSRRIQNLNALFGVAYREREISVPQFGSAHSPTLPLDPQSLKFIDSFITTQLAHQKFPGLAVGIYSREEILLANKGYGQANVELSVPVKPEPIFQSGSVGKQFVSSFLLPS